MTKSQENPSEIAVTLFNVREYCKTEEELVRSLYLLHQIGYTTVQVSGISLDPKIVRKHLDEFGMYCCATHESQDDILFHPEEVCKKLDILQCDFSAFGAPAKAFRCHAGMKELARKMNENGKIFAKFGKMLAYHNHHFEFDRQGQEKRLIDTFYENCDPEFVKAEIDVEWVARAGANPVTWIHRLGDRLQVIHFKDYTMVTSPDGNPEPTLCEIGEGNLEWPDIIKACREEKVKFFSVEQDTPFPGRNIFDSMSISYANMKKFGMGK